MSKSEHFNSLKENLSNKIIFLGNKPEETHDSTLKALWFAATRMSKSAKETAEFDLPELMAGF